MVILCVPVEDPTVASVLKSIAPALEFSMVTCCPSVPLLKNSLDDCALFVSFPNNIPFAPAAITSRYATVEDVPIETLPELFMTNGVRSGLELSSTTNAFPVPTCVIDTRSEVDEADAIIRPVTFSIVPSKVRLDSTVPFG